MAACGLIEIAKHVQAKESEKYLSAAVNLLKVMEKDWCDWSVDTDAILKGSSEWYAGGHDKNIIYGDFYFVEAILKLTGRKFLIW